ncbi:hypothetical protein LUZ61_003936 [Rhynchospora tenuis]|uniref:Fucosyltransferase n=1 Tax=Rhynchospora tenuis TaxID=198213 RepID=A0AAD5ZLP8_9POAL|nr:hypothetical protein LUZ61_003936 [Rhynchospora tenuis]
MPSSYLKQKLRNYEAHHKKCGPNTPLYQKSIEQLNSGHSVELMECNYVVWIPYMGLGNRILTLVSTFLYAILTNRVMLIHVPDDTVDLFCEPFPDTSWILPPDFPIKNLNQLDVNSNVTYRNMLDKHVISNDPNTKVESLPSYVYVHLSHDIEHSDRVLPEIDLNGTTPWKTNEPRSKAILVASLNADYYERLKSMYYEHSAKSGEFVSVYQPSHEERQKTEIQSHNQKALAEIYLLSLCDVLMTSAYSTFGYIGYGLAGIKPIFLMTVHDKVPDPPCARAVSREPCNLTPLLNTCTGKTVDEEKFQQHVKQCEDVDHGIKLFD